jgi:hypothetical protein
MKTFPSRIKILFSHSPKEYRIVINLLIRLKKRKFVEKNFNLNEALSQTLIRRQSDLVSSSQTVIKCTKVERIVFNTVSRMFSLSLKQTDFEPTFSTRDVL